MYTVWDIKQYQDFVKEFAMKVYLCDFISTLYLFANNTCRIDYYKNSQAEGRVLDFLMLLFMYGYKLYCNGLN